MNFHELIFSERKKYKVLRHVLFCSSILLYSFLRIGIMYPVDHFRAMFASYFSWTLYWTSLILGFSYITVYVFVPKYLYKKKYVSFCLSVLLIYSAMYMINGLQVYYQLNKTFNIVAGVRSQNIFQSANLVRLLGNPPLVCGLLLSLKSLKNWYLRKIESDALTRANTNAELQLLKSQIHPHFLFNT
ncbi:MAG TPA: histidine kinase, partial [Puia sp.]